MVKEIELSVPTSWADISLKKYLEYTKELKNYEDDEEAQTAITLFHLCGLDPMYLKRLAVDDYATIRHQLAQFIGNTEFPLERIVTIDNVEYGFEPNLSEMSYGAYVDITQYKELTIDENWAKIMNILYRPIVEKDKKYHTIERYAGDTHYERWLDVPMSIHFGTLFFFASLSMDLLKSTQKYLMAKELPQDINLILERSGEIIQRSIS
jgi:hypothetical protein